MKEEKNNQIIIYNTEDGQAEIEVNLKNETVWLSQKQMAELFDCSVDNISLHLKNIFKEAELSEKTVVEECSITATDGKNYLVKHYNLDAIISVGYKINSLRGTQFRIWATQVLRKYLLQGYAINEKRLLEAQDKFKQLQETITFLQKQSKKELLHGQESEILSLLSDYSRTLSLLEQYDKGGLKTEKGEKSKFVLEYENCLKIIKEIKKELLAKKEAGDLFGQERGGSFEGVIKGLYQTFAKKELYKFIEDKAAHLLYLTIKDHSFSDGNKRIASFLFVYFLDKNSYLYRSGGERKINDNALTALALLIAESDPKEKDQMIALIAQLLR